MGLYDRMTEKVRVYEKTVETDTWTEVLSAAVPITFKELSAAGTRREVALLEAGATHSARIQKNSKIEAGHRLKRISDVAEFRVVTVRHQDRPYPGQTELTLVEEEAAIEPTG